MSFPVALAAPIGFAVVFTVVGCITLRQGRRAWRRFGVARELPLISDVTLHQIDELAEEWPLSERRWPIPRVPEIAADPVVASAYARLARRTEQGLVYAAEVSAILGAAWLGINLLEIWGQLVDTQKEIVALLDEGDGIGMTLAVYTNVHLWLALLPLLPIAGGIALRAKANRYGDARSVYEQAAANDGSEYPPALSPPQPAADKPIGLRARIRRLPSQ